MGVSARVQLAISDNASSDNTSEIVKERNGRGIELKYQRQSSNVGFDGNVMSLFQSCTSEYLWFFADDDLPCKNSLMVVLNCIDASSPTIIRFSFAQPSDAQNGAFSKSTELGVDSEAQSAIEHLIRFPKISTYVFKVRELRSEDKNYISRILGDGFGFLAIGVALLYSTENAKLVAISDVLAKCDEDFDRLDWTPEPMLNMYRIADHPFVHMHEPKLQGRLKSDGYRSAIQFCYAAKVGALRVKDPVSYDKFVATFPWKLSYLIPKPKSLLQLAILKFKVRCEQATELIRRTLPDRK